MKLQEIQPNLSEVVQSCELFAAVQDLIFADDGLQDPGMEAALKDKGLAILVMAPQGTGMTDKARGCVVVDYSTTVWIRTNPKARSVAHPVAWNPLLCESAILAAVMHWSKLRNDLGFHLTPDLPPETDWTDVGNNSRLIRSTTRVQFN